MRDVILMRAPPGAAVDVLVRRALETLEIVYRGEAPRTVQTWSHAGSGLAMIQATAEGAPDAVEMFRNEREAFTYSGFVSVRGFTPAELKRQIRVTMFGKFVVGDSVGGIATFFHADAHRRRCHVWSSHAGVEGLFVTQGECLAISNRSLISHLVGTQRLVPVMSRRWASRVLLGGSSLWDDTPYEGTTQPPPRTMLVVDGGVIRHAEHPIPLATHPYRDHDPGAIEALNAANLAAVSVLRRWPRAELQLSGGKDSRYVAALVKKAGIDVDLVTHGTAATGEGPAAEAIARALGLPHRFTTGDIVTGDALLSTVLSNLRRSDGLLSEARQLAYRPLPHAGNPLVQGQAHHPRGGSHTITRRTAQTMKHEVLLPQNMGDLDLVVDELVRERRARLDEIIDGYEVPRPADLAYWMYNDWRMTRWTIASYLSASRFRPVVWPMMDERVLQVCSKLSTFDRVSEMAFFGALQALSPELAPIPLYKDKWKFDNADEAPKRFPQGFEQRRIPFTEGGRGHTLERRVPTVQPLFRMATQELSYSDELRSLIRPEVLEILREEVDPAAALGIPNIRVVQFMWKATAVALVVEGSWFNP